MKKTYKNTTNLFTKKEFVNLILLLILVIIIFLSSLIIKKKIELQIEKEKLTNFENIKFLVNNKKSSENLQTSLLTKNITIDLEKLYKRVKSKKDIPYINFLEAKYLFDKNEAIFVDARLYSEYEINHIKGAVPLPLNTFDKDINNIKQVLGNKIIITYCHGIDCHLSDKLAYLLYDKGYRKILIFFGGLNDWLKAKYPIETGKFHNYSKD